MAIFLYFLTSSNLYRSLLEISARARSFQHMASEILQTNFFNIIDIISMCKDIEY